MPIANLRVDAEIFTEVLPFIQALCRIDGSGPDGDGYVSLLVEVDHLPEEATELTVVVRRERNKLTAELVPAHRSTRVVHFPH